MQHCDDQIYAIRRYNRVRVQEPQYVASRNARASMHLHATSSFRRNELRTARTRNFPRVVITAAVHNYDLRWN
jgi:hypothetical protein